MKRDKRMLIENFLESGDVIDWKSASVSAKAAELADGCMNETEIARRCYEFVRDHIRHSWDYRLNPVTCKASEVLLHGTGYCYAKSHLLAALLRANGIPAGLCYQRLMIEGDGPSYCLHGLNAVNLKEFGWYRIDARGNKPGVEAEFSPPVESLAFQVVHPGEADLPEIWPEPLPIVVETLLKSENVEQVYQNLPDLCLIDNALECTEWGKIT